MKRYVSQTLPPFLLPAGRSPASARSGACPAACPFHLTQLIYQNKFQPASLLPNARRLPRRCLPLAPGHARPAVPPCWDRLSHGDITCLWPLSRCPAGVGARAWDGPRRAPVGAADGIDDPAARPTRGEGLARANSLAGAPRPSTRPAILVHPGRSRANEVP